MSPTETLVVNRPPNRGNSSLGAGRPRFPTSRPPQVGQNEDPLLCVPGFCRVCLCRTSTKRPQGDKCSNSDPAGATNRSRYRRPSPRWTPGSAPASGCKLHARRTGLSFLAPTFLLPNAAPAAAGILHPPTGHPNSARRQQHGGVVGDMSRRIEGREQHGGTTLRHTQTRRAVRPDRRLRLGRFRFGCVRS